VGDEMRTMRNHGGERRRRRRRRRRRMRVLTF
jgi:hypothetical protein